MVYIGSNGSLQEKKKFTLFGFLVGIFKGIFDIVGLFFSSITGNPHQITANRNTRNTNNVYRPNRARGANIRTVKSLQSNGNTPCAGGG